MVDRVELTEKFLTDKLKKHPKEAIKEYNELVVKVNKLDIAGVQTKEIKRIHELLQITRRTK